MRFCLSGVGVGVGKLGIEGSVGGLGIGVESSGSKEWCIEGVCHTLRLGIRVERLVNLRTDNSQKCEAVPKRARISGS